MKKNIRLLSILILSIISINSNATHLVVGEITYNYLGNNNYEIVLTYYRDCLNGDPQAIANDEPVAISVYKGNSFYAIDSNIVYSSQNNISFNNPYPCITSNPSYCINKAVFKKIFNLPASADTFTIIAQRCCMSEAITNIDNASNKGYSFFIKIPPQLNGVNNPAQFAPVSNTIFCVNKNYVINHSATDLDGDSLTYSFKLPDLGGSQSSSKPGFLGFTLPTIQQDNYKLPNTLQMPMPGISLNQSTGILTVNTTLQGLYAINVAAHEWRNGIIINTVKRTYVYQVFDCDFDVSANIECDKNLVSATQGKYCLANCSNKTIQFKNKSNGANAYHWDFGVASLGNDTSNVFEPSYTFPDTGKYTITLIAFGATCNDTITQIISIGNTSITSDFDYSGKLCSGNPIQFNNLSNSTDDVVSYWIWNFTSNNLVITDLRNNPDIAFVSPGNVRTELFAYTSQGCADSSTKEIVITGPTVIAHDDAILPKGSSVDLYATGGINYLWEFNSNGFASFNQNNVQNVKLYALYKGKVKVIVTGFDANNCSDKDTLDITVTEGAYFYVPTAFSPNNDRINDLLSIKLSGYTLKYFKIYNRRGQCVFETTNKYDTWDGKLKGGNLGIDTYFWVACIEDNNKKVSIERGDVTLVR
jgi:gliding motility-associated-like protein